MRVSNKEKDGEEEDGKEEEAKEKLFVESNWSGHLQAKIIIIFVLISAG